MFNGNPKGTYKDMQKEHKAVQKLMQEWLMIYPFQKAPNNINQTHKWP